MSAGLLGSGKSGSTLSCGTQVPLGLGRHMIWGLVRSFICSSFQVSFVRVCLFVSACLAGSLFFCGGGNMEFDLGDFTTDPTVAKLDKCTKEDLLLAANFFFM